MSRRDEAESHNSESLSDIDDDEVIKYLHTEEEKHLKKIIWETMNDDYIKEQAAKEAADASRAAAYEANQNSCNREILEGAEQLAAAVAAAVSKSKKEKQQKRAEEAKNSLQPQTAAEAISRMLAKKRLSSKINYDVLKKLFDDNVTSEKMKKHRTGDDDVQIINTSKMIGRMQLKYKTFSLGMITSMKNMILAEAATTICIPRIRRMNIMILTVTTGFD